MPNRILLQTVANQAMADIALARLQEAGYPVVGAQPGLPYPDLVSPVEIYLLEPEILDEPGAREEIEELLNPPAEEGLTEADAAAIEAMPREAEPAPQKPGQGRRWGCIGFLFVLALASIWIYFAGAKSQPNYRFLEASQPDRLHPDEKEYLVKSGLHGGQFKIDRPFKETLEIAQKELEGRGFQEEVEDFRTTFWTYDSTRFGFEEEEIVAVSMGYEWSSTKNEYVHNPKVTKINWYYRPNFAQQVRALLGG